LIGVDVASTEIQTDAESFLNEGWGGLKRSKKQNSRIVDTESLSRRWRERIGEGGGRRGGERKNIY